MYINVAAAGFRYCLGEERWRSELWCGMQGLVTVASVALAPWDTLRLEVDARKMFGRILVACHRREKEHENNISEHWRTSKFHRKVFIEDNLGEFHELLAESGYTCACASKPCAPWSLMCSLTFLDDMFDSIANGCQVGIQPGGAKYDQALMAVSRELRSFVSSCLSELQVAIAGGMAILSWEAQSVERSTADHRTGFANRISRIWTEASVARLLAMLVLSGAQRSYKGASAACCKSLNSIVGIQTTFANSRFCPASVTRNCEITSECVLCKVFAEPWAKSKVL